MKFKMPNLGSILLSTKVETDSRNYVTVIGNNAIVQNKIIVVVDLREYVKKECNLSEEHEYQELDAVLAWMNGKSFTKAFWDELKKECFVEVSYDSLKIEYASFNKTLEYNEPGVEVSNMLQSIFDNIGRACVTVDRVAFDGDIIKKIHSAVPELKNDVVILDFTGKEHPIKFTGENKDYIFGLIPSDYNSTENIFVFQNINKFKDILQTELLKD